MIHVKVSRICTRCFINKSKISLGIKINIGIFVHMTKKIINFMLIGFGPHAMRIYHPLFESGSDTAGLNLCVAIDLKSAENKIKNYLKDKTVVPEFFFIENDLNNPEELHPSIENVLANLIKVHKIDAVIIASEPLTHYVYCKWAIKNNLSIMLDKPTSTYKNVSTSTDKAKKILEDYLELNSLYKEKTTTNSPIVFSVMAQRRYQTSFNLIKQLIEECQLKTGCPITNVQTHHSDGQWRMPTEIVEQLYHPYNQGYGKCSHSGYHYFDIIPYVLQSGLSDSKFYDAIETMCSVTRPTDNLEQLNLSDYRRLFGDDMFNETNRYSTTELNKIMHTYGEIDCGGLISLKMKGKVMTVISLNLSHGGYSQRNWVTAKNRDLYKGNGRVSHESHIFQQGPFQTIHFHSYKSDNQYCPMKHPEWVGTKEHLEIYVFRNDKMLGGEHVKVYTFDDIMKMEGGRKGIWNKSKSKAFSEFIACLRGNITRQDLISDFSKHELGSTITSAIYQSMAAKFTNQNPMISLELNNNFYGAKKLRLKQVSRYVHEEFCPS